MCFVVADIKRLFNRGESSSLSGEMPHDFVFKIDFKYMLFSSWLMIQPSFNCTQIAWISIQCPWLCCHKVRLVWFDVYLNSLCSIPRNGKFMKPFNVIYTWNNTYFKVFLTLISVVMYIVSSSTLAAIVLLLRSKATLKPKDPIVSFN